MSTLWPSPTGLINNYCSNTKQLLIGIFTRVAYQYRIQMFSGVDAARLSRRKFRRTSIATGSRSSQKVERLKSYPLPAAHKRRIPPYGLLTLTEQFAISPIEFP